MLARIVSFQREGLIVGRPLSRRQWTIAYGEILTAERLRNGRGLRLHTRTSEPVRVPVRGFELLNAESAMRDHGVRVVDCWGAILTRTLAEFEEALDQEPVSVRQSYDNA
jgi:hypothetical protein